MGRQFQSLTRLEYWKHDKLCLLCFHFTLRAMHITLPSLLVIIHKFSFKHLEENFIPSSEIYTWTSGVIWTFFCFRPGSSLSNTDIAFRASAQMAPSLILHSISILLYTHKKMLYFILFHLHFKSSLECINKPFGLPIESWMEWRYSDIFNRLESCKNCLSHFLWIVLCYHWKWFWGQKTNKKLLEKTMYVFAFEYLRTFCVPVYNY